MTASDNKNADPSGVDDFLITNEYRQQLLKNADGKGSRRFIILLMALCLGASVCTLVGYRAVKVEDNSPNLKATVSKLTGETIVIAENNHKNKKWNQNGNGGGVKGGGGASSKNNNMANNAAKTNKNKNAAANKNKNTVINSKNKNNAVNSKNKNKQSSPPAPPAPAPVIVEEEVRIVETPSKKQQDDSIKKQNTPPSQSNQAIKEEEDGGTIPANNEEEEVEEVNDNEPEETVEDKEEEVVVEEQVDEEEQAAAAAEEVTEEQSNNEATTDEEETSDVAEDDEGETATETVEVDAEESEAEGKGSDNNVVDTTVDDGDDDTDTETTTTDVEEEVEQDKKDEDDEEKEEETSELGTTAESKGKTKNNNNNNNNNNQIMKKNNIKGGTEEEAILDELPEVKESTAAGSGNNGQQKVKNTNKNKQTTTANKNVNKNNQKNKQKNKTNNKAGAGGATTTASSKYYNGNDVADLLDRSKLLDLAEQQKKVLLEKLYVDYGKDHFENIFMDPNNPGRFRGIRSFGDDESSEEKLKRKFLIKVLEVQKEISKNGGGSNGGTGVEEQKRDARKLRSDPNNNNMDLDDVVDTSKIYNKIVWATGGHSASAGHGNMYNESYTAYLSRDMLPFFSNFGIDFEARNYAMGGTSSGFDVSSCYPQIFGNDVDIFTWDYGMTTIKNDAKIAHYVYRATVSNSNPVLVMMHQSQGRNSAGYLLEHFTQDKGMAVFQMAGIAESPMKAAIPDSAAMTDAQILELPEYIRNLKCDTSLESGDPYCKDEKYTTYYCPDRAQRAGWHPGFKVHAMDGHVLSLFLMQTFMDALKDLSEHVEKDPEILLAQLKQDDMKLSKQFSNTPMIDTAGSKHNVGVQDNSDRSFDEKNKDFLDAFFQGDVICRNSRLPSRSRYLGYATTKNKVGDIISLGNETFDIGISLEEATETASTSIEEMRLVYGSGGRDYECADQILHPDRGDFWQAQSSEGWVKFPTFPNKKEKKAYGYNKSKFKGHLLVKLPDCAWGKCKDSDVRLGKVKGVDDGLETGTLEMTVNGKKVFSVIQLRDMSLLLGRNGKMIWEPSETGDYEIAVRVKGDDKYFRIMAAVLV